MATFSLNNNLVLTCYFSAGEEPASVNSDIIYVNGYEHAVDQLADKLAEAGSSPGVSHNIDLKTIPTLDCPTGDYYIKINYYPTNDSPDTVSFTTETVTYTGIEGSNTTIESNSVVYSKTKYFDNKTLNELWERLVNATQLLPNYSASWILTDRYDEGALYIDGVYLHATTDTWIVSCSDDPNELYYLYTDEVLDLSLLNIGKSYNVSSAANNMYATLVYDNSNNNWGPVTFDDSNMQGYVSLHTGYNVLETVDAVEYTIYNSDGNAVKSGFGFYYPEYTDSGTTPLTDLPNGNYIVRITDPGASGMSSLVGLEGTLTIGNNNNTVEGTAKWIHNTLIKHSKLTRETAPVTPADYMKGIAICARYMNNVPNYLDGSNTLAEIVHFVENCTNTVANVEASVKDGVLTMRSGLDHIRWYDVMIWTEEAYNSGSEPFATATVYPDSSSTPFETSKRLSSIFIENFVTFPDNGTNLYIRVEADDDNTDPYVDIQAVWSTDPDVVAIFTELELTHTTDGYFLEDGQAYYANDTYFVAVLGTGADCPTPPSDTVIETDGNRGTVVWEGSGWCVRWDNNPSEERTVVFRKTALMD